MNYTIAWLHPYYRHCHPWLWHDMTVSQGRIHLAATMSWWANQHARQRTTRTYAQCDAQKLKMKSKQIPFLLTYLHNVFSIVLPLWCSFSWSVKGIGSCRGMEGWYRLGKGTCSLHSRLREDKFAHSDRGHRAWRWPFLPKMMNFNWSTWKLVRMVSNVMSIGSFFWLAHVSSPMPVFRHAKNLVASSSQATIHGICLVMHTSRLPATWVPWWGYARLFVDICKLSSPRTPSSRCVFDATMFNYYTWRQTKNFGVNQIDQWALKWAG